MPCAQQIRAKFDGLAQFRFCLRRFAQPDVAESDAIVRHGHTGARRLRPAKSNGATRGAARLLKRTAPAFHEALE